MPLIGTAGHVDHGKSTLVQALTGRDPDRWEEEKRRGLTIDLGFAWTTLDLDQEVSFVDVPGHERYLKNMLAGIEAIDVALFVVAADEGWMPQSEEHLAVLDLLEIENGVIALTKLDVVDNETLELAVTEVRERLAGTGLASAEIIPVSARTGAGLDHLRTALSDLVGKAVIEGDRPRLWVDRSFSVAGAGTVVTGSLIEGSLEVGNTVEILPARKTARIRALQSHETEIAVARPGRRLAVNLSGVDLSDVPRGSMLGLPKQWLLTNRFTAQLRVPRYLDEMPAKGAFHLHLGSGAYPVTIKRRQEELALLQVPSPLPMRTGDRFILRDTGRKLVVAGGVVIDPAPGGSARALLSSERIDPKSGRNRVATDLLAIRGIDELTRLDAHSGGGRPQEAITVGSIAITPERFGDLLDELEQAVAVHHAEHPLRAGIPSATLATSLHVSQAIVDRLVEESPVMERSGPDVARIDHRQGLDEDMEKRWSRAQTMLGSNLAVPGATELGLDAELIHLLIRNGNLVRVSGDLVFLTEQVDQIVGMIRGMEPGFTVADFRDRTGLSRKYAVPLLEWSDKEGLTIRRGDQRHLR